MNKKTKVFLLFFVLAVTPFYRGCDYMTGKGESWSEISVFSYGFPFPVAPFSAPGYVLSHLEFFYGILLLTLNILVAYVLARIITSKEKYINKLSLFLIALAINLCMLWFTVIMIIKPFWIVSFYYTAAIPEFIYQKTKISLELLSRIWFIIITFLLTGLLYIIKKIRSKGQNKIGAASNF